MTVGTHLFKSSPDKTQEGLNTLLSKTSRPNSLTPAVALRGEKRRMFFCFYILFHVYKKQLDTGYAYIITTLGCQNNISIHQVKLQQRCSYLREESSS